MIGITDKRHNAQCLERSSFESFSHFFRVQLFTSHIEICDDHKLNFTLIQGGVEGMVSWHATNSQMLEWKMKK